MKKLNLMLHCGANGIEREQLEAIETPRNTRTWYPIPHDLLLRHVESHLIAGGMEVVHEAHGATHDGNRYFGMLQVQPRRDVVEGRVIDINEIDGGITPTLRDASDDFGLVVGVRNSHDKSFPGAIAMGSGVFVCDNLAFSGEIQVARKHTRHIMRDLERLTATAVERLVSSRIDQIRRFEAYKRTEISETQAHDLVIRALDAKAVTATAIPRVVEQWRNPSHPEFAEAGKTVWRLFNAFTEVSKSSSPITALQRGPRLHGIMDQACHLAV